jgi:hypothetical protein
MGLHSRHASTLLQDLSVILAWDLTDQAIFLHGFGCNATKDQDHL